MLNLTGLSIENIKEKEDGYLFSVAVSEDPPDFDCCLLQELVLNGRKEAFFTDCTMHGKRVELRMMRQRYKCKACGKPAYGTIPHMHEDHRMTQRCYAYICKNGARRTWAALGDELGLDPQTISKAWNRWADAELAKIKMDTPRWMGLDEIHIKGRARAVITNIEHRALVNMLPNREIATLKAYFTSADFDPKKVEVLTIDMWSLVDQPHILVTQNLEVARRNGREESQPD